LDNPPHLSKGNTFNFYLVLFWIPKRDDPLKHASTLGNFSQPIKMSFFLVELMESDTYLWAQRFKIIIADLIDLGLLSTHFRREIYFKNKYFYLSWPT
jgi:hypothetical protein